MVWHFGWYHEGKDTNGQVPFLRPWLVTIDFRKPIFLSMLRFVHSPAINGYEQTLYDQNISIQSILLSLQPLALLRAFEKSVHIMCDKNCIAMKQLLRKGVGPPANMNWERPWNEILHGSVSTMRLSNMIFLAYILLTQCWKVVACICSLPSSVPAMFRSSNFHVQRPLWNSCWFKASCW